MTQAPSLAIGLMSGTSLDGVDVALVRFTGDRPAAELVAFRTVPYEPAFRVRLLELIDHGRTRDAALLHVELGARVADAVAGLLSQAGVAARDVAFVASHGQTVWHEPGLATLQLGDPAVIAERIGVAVVSDSRARDVAAGGQGAPLVPIADALLFAARDRPRVLLNVGGMANVTLLNAKFVSGTFGLAGATPGQKTTCYACHNQTVKDASGSYRTYEQGGFVKSEQGCTVCHSDLKRVSVSGHRNGGK